jgi:hypothetical protein
VLARADLSHSLTQEHYSSAAWRDIWVLSVHIVTYKGLARRIIWWLGLLDASVTITVDTTAHTFNSGWYNRSHIQLLLNLSLLSESWRVSKSLEFSVWLSESRTELTYSSPCLTVPLLFCFSVFIRCHGNVLTKSLSSNSLFRDALGMWLAKRCLADGHIPVFRRHVTMYFTLNSETKY